jgi:hypothetical protein
MAPEISADSRFLKTYNSGTQEYNLSRSCKYDSTLREPAPLSEGKLSIKLAHADVEGHHLTHEHYSYEDAYWDADLVVLCDECHSEHHSEEKREFK